MNRRFIAFVIAMALVPAGALADAVHGHGKEDSAVGRPGDPKNISMTIKVEMSDTMRFTPARITARRGQTIKFVVTNTGKVRHEMVLGTAGELKAHAALMRKFPEMEHADRNQITVEAGKTGEIVWQFTRGGTFDFACLEPGHFEAEWSARWWWRNELVEAQAPAPPENINAQLFTDFKRISDENDRCIFRCGFAYPALRSRKTAPAMMPIILPAPKQCRHPMH